MMMTTDAVEVRVRHKLTQNFPRNDLFIEIDDLQGNPVSAFSDSRQAHAWLRANGFRYLEGSSGVWTRKRKGGLIVIPRFDEKAKPWREKVRADRLSTIGWTLVVLAAAVWLVLM